MLSDQDIFKALAAGSLIIEPFDKAQVRPAGLSLSLGNQILVPQPVKLIDFRASTDIPYEEHNLTADKPFIIQPGQFVLGHTKEAIGLSTKLGFIIEGRSTLARLGVSVEQSATLVDSGAKPRHLTLEIYNCGPSPVTLYAGMSVARAAVFNLSSPAKRAFEDFARYAAQKKGAGKPILRERSD